MSKPIIVDAIMLANSKSQHLIDMTARAIETLHASESRSEVRFDVTVMETCKSAPRYARAERCIHPQDPFNYNRFLNIGLQFGNSPWVALLNNDLLFHGGWMSAILAVAEKNPQVGSFSPWNPAPWQHDKLSDCFIGYGIGGVVTGWCLVARREIFERVKLREEVSFWCSDNTYQDELIKHGIPHALCRNSWVDHLGGKTLFTETNERIHELTAGQVEAYGRMEK
jgi:GT2 family glycosyltransferase